MHRGSTYWLWADCGLPHVLHSEIHNEAIIDVQSRLSRQGVTQLFLGVYSKMSEPIHEEAYRERCGESIATAMCWGINKARSIATEATNI